MHSIMTFPKRTIHLDFHVGPGIQNVGADFNRREFVQTIKKAHIDSVTLFAMCHHGFLYYDTKHPARHPGLSSDIHLLEEQIDALHSAGIRAPIYLSVQCNEYAAQEHPEWVALTSDIRQVKRADSAFEAGWSILDMSSPYQDYFTEIFREVLDKFSPVDGMFLDMCWDQPSCSKWAIDGMKKRGFDPRNEKDRLKYARIVSHDYMRRYSDIINGRNVSTLGIWFNSRPKTNLQEEKAFLKHVEIESLPTGGWGYSYFPYISRFVRPLGLATLSHTGRFFGSWGDGASLKPEMALKYECCQILSQNMANGVGDYLHPSGKISKPVYELIGKIYGYIESCEPYVKNYKIESQIALIVNPEAGDEPGPSGIGAVRMLRQLRLQFDILPPGNPIDGYELVIIPEMTGIDNSMACKLREYLSAGGSLIISGASALGKDGAPVGEMLGIDVFGPSPYSHTFLHPLDAIPGMMDNFGHVFYERGFRMKPKKGSEALVAVGEPYFERSYDQFCGHEYTPENAMSEYSAVVKSGRVITCSVPVFESYGLHADPYCRKLLKSCVDLLVKPLLVDNGPSYLEATVLKNGSKTAVHLLSFIPERRAENMDVIEEAIPIVDLEIAVKCSAEPASVFLSPAGKKLEYAYSDGYVRTNISFGGGHAMLMID